MQNKVTNVAQAFDVLIQAVEIGRSKGVYSFDDAALIKEAIDFIQDLAKQTSENKKEDDSE